MSNPGVLLPAGGSEYTVVLRARSSARFLPEEGWEHNFSLPDLELGPVRTRAFTRWVAGAYSVPRELVIEVKGRAGSLDEAGAKFSMVASPIASAIAFVANVRVGPVEAHLGFDSDPNGTERQFLEVFLPDERGGVAEGRIIRRHLLEVVCPAIASMPVDGPRVGRALRQYELALREWYIGGEWLALSHLWIAVENLTEAVLRRTKVELSKTDEELAQMLDVVTDDPERPRWKQIMREQIREQIIFDGDHDTYATAKKASDGLEHGFLELDEVARRAIASAGRTFTCVRRAIIDLLDLPRDIATEMMEIKPKDVQSARKIIRGSLLGAAEDPAADDQMYPLLEWASSIDSVVREGSAFHMKPREKVTVRTNPDIQFRFDRIEMFGRLAEGEQPRELREDELTVTKTTGADPAELMNTVVPLVDAAVASRAETAYNGAQVIAFNLFAQGVAFFQSAQTLITGSQPAEALPSLRGLTLIAARFEQMTGSEGSGLGIVLRMALNSFEELGADHDHTEQAQGAIRQVSDQLGITVPDALPDPESTAIHKSLNLEMNLARTTLDGSYAIVGLHVQGDNEQRIFHTKRQPDFFTDMISTACVIAQLELLKHAARLFDWSLAVTGVDELIAKATAINTTAAQGAPSAGE